MEKLKKIPLKAWSFLRKRLPISVACIEHISEAVSISSGRIETIGFVINVITDIIRKIAKLILNFGIYQI